MSPQVSSSPALVVAAACSASAGMVHAAMAGSHAEHRLLAISFGVTALLQVAWAVAVLVRTASRPVVLAGVGLQIAALGAWLASRSVGIGFVDGLQGSAADRLPGRPGRRARSLGGRHRAGLARPVRLATGMDAGSGGRRCAGARRSRACHGRSLMTVTTVTTATMAQRPPPVSHADHARTRRRPRRRRRATTATTTMHRPATVTPVRSPTANRSLRPTPPTRRASPRGSTTPMSRPSSENGRPNCSSTPPRRCRRSPTRRP